VFVHISAVERAGLSGPDKGQVVEYEEVANKGKTSAEDLKVQRWRWSCRQQALCIELGQQLLRAAFPTLFPAATVRLPMVFAINPSSLSLSVAGSAARGCQRW
jgi:'Cold-shock' DNA-binding domain